jgi:hypothetical protein
VRGSPLIGPKVPCGLLLDINGKLEWLVNGYCRLDCTPGCMEAKMATSLCSA